jgi:tRNA (mo5U34)-methyltransferase
MSLSHAEIKEKINSVANWYHRIEIKPGIVTPGINDSPAMLRALQIPQDCSGLRVLDLGTRDGFFAFEFEKRGAAEVVALDYFPKEKTGFAVAAELLGSKVTYVQANIYEVTPEKYGLFDVVLFLGLIYHLPDPLGALDIARAVCKDELYLETHIIDNAFLVPHKGFVPLASISEKLLEIPLMQFFPKNSLNQDYTNYWGPNSKGMQAMLEESNFAVTYKQVNGARAVFKCKVVSDDNMTYLRNIARGADYPA